MSSVQVCRKETVSKSRLSAALSAAWGRVSNKLGKGTFADKAEMSTKTIDRALTGPSLPDVEHFMNSLVADPTALQEVFALYDLKVGPKQAEAANDMALVTDMSNAVAEFLKRISDGQRCHIDEAVLAQLFRPIIPQMQAIVDADRERRAA